jgi:hypothetical protein
MSFKEYWELNEEFYTQIGVTRAVAHKIWCDAVDQVEKKVIQYYIDKL